MMDSAHTAPVLPAHVRGGSEARSPIPITNFNMSSTYNERSHSTTRWRAIHAALTRAAPHEASGTDGDVAKESVCKSLRMIGRELSRRRAELRTAEGPWSIG